MSASKICSREVASISESIAMKVVASSGKRWAQKKRKRNLATNDQTKFRE
jgi:hypothetical protein